MPDDLISRPACPFALIVLNCACAPEVTVSSSIIVRIVLCISFLGLVRE